MRIGSAGMSGGSHSGPFRRRVKENVIARPHLNTDAFSSIAGGKKGRKAKGISEGKATTQRKKVPQLSSWRCATFSLPANRLERQLIALASSTTAHRVGLGASIDANMATFPRRRYRILPRQVSDVGAFFFVSFMIPATFIYETRVVLPAVFPGAATMYANMVLGAFLLLNIVGNFVGLWLTDTSTLHVILPATIRQKWEFCASCEAVQPPRAWHCSVCGVCILKREHHCMFAGYCVGHRNHRYFCLFLFYMWLAVIYCTYLNTHFLALHINEVTWAMVPKFIFPLLSLITFDLSWLQAYMFFWSVHFAATLLTSVLVAYHANLVLHGKTTHENNAGKNYYNLGWRQNLLEVFGDNWRRVLFWPFATSRLPHDGVNW